MDTHIDHPPNEPPKIDLPDMQQAPDFCCPCGGFLGWKQIRLGGKSLSRSFGDLRALGNAQTQGWAWESPTPAFNSRRPSLTKSREVKPPVQPIPGTSALERLPPEVLGMFFFFFAFFFVFRLSEFACVSC